MYFVAVMQGVKDLSATYNFCLFVCFKVEGQDGSQPASPRYQGVRVKNTVKELIMQKRHGEVQVRASL